MIEERFARTDGGRVTAYSRFSQQSRARHESPPGPVVLLHGSPGSRHDWRPVVDELDDRLQLIVFDRPGYGLSQPAGKSGETITENARAIGGVLREVAPDGSVLVGHSLAGGVALRIAIDQPELVRGLVLVSSIGTSPALLPSDHLTALPLVGELICFVMFRVLGRMSPRVIAHAATARGPAPPKKVIAASLRRTFQMKGAWRTYVREERSMIRETPEIESRLGEIRVPSLVVWGDEDRLIPRDAALELVERIPGAGIRILGETGHSVPQERPAELAKIIEDLNLSLRVDDRLADRALPGDLFEPSME